MPPDLRRQTFRAPQAVGLKRPEPRNTIETYASQLLGKGVVRSAPLEGARHRSGSVEIDGFSDLSGLKDDFEVFQNRDLIGIDLDYLFLDGSHFKMHDGTNAEPVMVA